jgi:ribonuclease HI
MDQLTETVEKNNLEALAEVGGQITLSSHANIMNSTKQEFGVSIPLMASLSSYMMEFEARLNQLTETFEKKHLEVLEKISQITLSSHASMNSTEHEPSCTIVFLGYANGHPGPAGAGAVLFADDGSIFCGFSEGLGCQTKQVADYRALNLGLKQAIMKGFKHVTVEGGPEHVINQFGKPWQIINLQARTLCLEAMKLSRSFHSFSIHHSPMDEGNQVIYQARRAIEIGDGQFEEENLLN